MKAIEADSRRRVFAGFLGLWALAALARTLYFLFAEPERIMAGLTHKYLVCAGHLLDGQGFMQQVTAGAEMPYVDRFPGYVVVLAVMKLSGLHSLTALSLAHGALGALQAPMLAALGRRTLGERVGFLGGLLLALFPPAWASDLQVLETGLTGLALIATAWALAVHVERASWRSGILLALCGSAAVALRADNMLVPAAAAAAGALLLPRAKWASLLPGLLLPLLLLVPWGLRNARVADGFFISVGAGNILLQGYAEFSREHRELFGDRNLARSEGHESLFWPEPGRRDAERRRKALRLIAADPFGWALGCMRRVPILLSLHAGELWPGGPGLDEHVRRWRERHPEAARFEGLSSAGLSYLREQPLRAAATLAWGPLLLVFAGVGAWRLRTAPHLLLLVLWSPLYGLLIHLPLHAEPRYFLPHAGMLALLAVLPLSVGGLGTRPSARTPLEEEETETRVEEEAERPVGGEAETPLRVLALLGAAEDARCLQRLRALRGEGLELRAMGFRRDGGRGLVAPPSVELLGSLRHGRHLRRLPRYALAWPRIAAAAWQSDAVLAFGSDLGALAALSMPRGQPLVVELADVRQALLGDGLLARLLRRLERVALARADLVVATSQELAREWLVGVQGAPAEKILVIENRVGAGAPARPRVKISREGALRIGWTGLLRCAASWAVLREAAARGEGRLTVVLHGIERDLPGLEREAREAPHVEWHGPYSSPEDLQGIHEELDAIFIAHAHGAANSRWARANRFFEAGWFGTVPIAQADTPDGRLVAAEDLGPVLDLRRHDEAVETLLALRRDELRRWSERLLALPDERFGHGGEQAILARRLRESCGQAARRPGR